MTIAVIKTGGKQYKVTKGQDLKIEKIKGEKGDKVKFDRVLLKASEDGKTFELGQPEVKSATVEAEILDQGREKKVKVMKYKRKTRYRRTAGHRQPYTKVKITKV